MKYKTLLFDADGTLFDFAKCEDVALRETLESFDIEATDAVVADYSAINESLWKMLERGEIEKRVLFYRRFELLCEKYGFLRDALEMSKKYAATLAEQVYLLDGAEELCEKLSGVADMYIVTNGIDFVQKRRYAKSGFEKYFKGVFISGEIGHEKPAAEFFEHVANAVPNFDKQSALMIGDSLTADIKGGINFGIDTCWYNPKNKPVPEDMEITNISLDFDEVYKFIMS